jgi:hypothetical protein
MGYSRNQQRRKKDYREKKEVTIHQNKEQIIRQGSLDVG